MYYRTRELASTIEAVGVGPLFSLEDVDKMLEDAMEFHYCRVVGPLCFTKHISDTLYGSGVGIALPIGTPVGVGESTTNKIHAARECVGASRVPVDVDMVMNLCYLRSGMYDEAFADVKAVRAAFPDNTLKVIVEALSLDDQQLKTACRIVVDADADYIKTSTGLHGPTTPEVVRKIRDIAGYNIGIKAAGGIRTLGTVESLIDELKVDRIGMNYTSARAFVLGLEQLEDGRKVH